MNVSGPLLMLLLTAAWTVSGQGSSRAVWQFGYMISCVQPGVNPFTWTWYLDYGCYCGPRGRGQGTPVDDLDRCCKVHDDCYRAQMKNAACRGFWRHFVHPYVVYYRYTCSKGQVTCLVTNGRCQKAACECDRAAALCFARSKYNPEHNHLDQKHCEK